MKLLDKMCKYEMDLASIVEDTEWTPFCTVHRRADGQGETSIPDFNFVEAEGIMKNRREHRKEYAHSSHLLSCDVAR